MSGLGGETTAQRGNPALSLNDKYTVRARMAASCSKNSPIVQFGTTTTKSISRADSNWPIRAGNWAELNFAETSGAVTRNSGKK